MLKTALLILCAAMLCSVMVACSPGSNLVPVSPAAGETKPEEYHQWRILYLCSDTKMKKLGTIAEKMKEKCEGNNIELIVIDCSGRDSIFLNTIDELNTMNLDGVIVTASNENLGPLIQEKCDESGLPLISIESRLKNSEGQEIPFVDINTYKGGYLMGKTIAEEARNRGFIGDDKKTSVLMLYMTNMVSASQIMNGCRNAMEEALPELYSENYITLEVISSLMEKQYLSVENYFNKLDRYTNYIMVAFNDEGAYALEKYAAENQLNTEHLLIGSMGGFDYSRDIFRSDMGDSYFVVHEDCEEIVEETINMMLDNLNDGTALSSYQLIAGDVISSENYQDFFQDKMS